MFCQQCGTQNEDTAQFCSSCGLNFNKLDTAQVTTNPSPPQTSQGGTAVPNIIIQQTTAQTAAHQQSAPQTYGVRGTYAGPPSEKSRTVAFILCLLGWIGLGGMHEFYAGRIGWGILYFFTFGLFFIGTLVHTISILTGNYRDVMGAPILVW